jgi:pyruvate carboxylase
MAWSPGQEISVELERGKTLIVHYVTRSEPHEDGTRTVFFELNGQPRSVRVTDRSQTPKRPPQLKDRPRQSAPYRRSDAGHRGHGERRRSGIRSSAAMWW